MSLYNASVHHVVRESMKYASLISQFVIKLYMKMYSITTIVLLILCWHIYIADLFQNYLLFVVFLELPFVHWPLSLTMYNDNLQTLSPGKTKISLEQLVMQVSTPILELVSGILCGDLQLYTILLLLDSLIYSSINNDKMRTLLMILQSKAGEMIWNL